MITLATEITNCGIDLDDPNQTYFTASNLTYWINQAALDIARRAECLMDAQTIATMTNVGVYAAPQDCIRMHEVTFSPNDPTQIYPLNFKGRQELNAIWFVNQTTPMTYPMFYTTWQQPPIIMVQLYPVPSQPGQIMFWYYRLPVPVVNNADFIDVPEGWDSALHAHVMYRARAKAGDQSWQDWKGRYEEILADLITASRNWTDATGSISQGGLYVPGWLYGGWGA